MKATPLVALLLVIHFSWGQTGPGGVGNAANNILWLSADNGVYTNVAGTTPASGGDNAAFWRDRSGNGNHASHGAAGQLPNYETGVVNGLPVLRFSAGNADRLLASGLATGNTASVWAVASWSSLLSSNPGIIQAAPAGSPFSTSTSEKVVGMWISNTAGNRLWGRGVQSNGTPRDIPQITTTAVNTFYSFLSRYDGVSNISQYVDNGLAGQVSYDGTLDSWAEFGIGRQAGESWNGDIAEVIVFNTAVNSAQRIIINNFLSAKYARPLAADDVYTMDDPANGNFDHEVAGIGRVDASNLHAEAQGSGLVKILNPTSLGNGDFLMWGHDNGSVQASVTTGVPGGVSARLERIWRMSETGNVGSVDFEFDLTGILAFPALSNCETAMTLRLLLDTDNDGSFSDETPVAGAVSMGSNIYRFTNVSGAGDAVRFTLAVIPRAPNGPAGVGAADGSSSLKLWFRTDQGVNTTGASVDSWSNAAGIAALDISESGGQRPTLVTGAVNGFNEISFSGSNRLRTGLTLTPANFVTDEASSFVVNRADNTTQNSSVYLTDPLENNRFSNHIPWGGSVYFDIGECCGADARLQVDGLAGLTGYSIWSYDAEPASGKQIYRNGSLLQNRPSTSTYTSHATHRFSIGGNIPGSAGFVGDVTEVIVFNSKINSAQRILIENYLSAKYSLALTANEVYVADDPGGNFDYDVAGIGRVDVNNIHDDAQGTGLVRIFNPRNLGNGEFMMWGHDNSSLTTPNTTDVPAGVQGRLSRVWRISERNTSGTNVNVGNVDIQFDLSSQVPITASDLRLLIDHDGDGNFSEAGTIQIDGAIALACDRYLFVNVPGGATGLQHGDRFTIGSINLSQTPLPIQLASFTGEIVDGDAHLQWKTLSENNNHVFTIERSSNGTSFTQVGQVPGSGTVKEPRHYQFEDRFAPYGKVYYRLKQTDYDGAYSHSDVIMLDNRASGTELIAVPNPIASGDEVTLRILHTEEIDTRKVQVTVYDLLGRNMNVSAEPDGPGQLLLRFGAHRRLGTYIIRVTTPEITRQLHTRILVH